ncbi:MAG: GNAT family N-acetyltransferase [Calditrichaeota bacterium]|nr:GNAT family N-acetyltransferase [Calditrichota bacterium]
MFEKNYPLTYKLKNDQEVTIRLLSPQDDEELFRFFSSLSDSEIDYFRANVRKREVVGKWSKESIDYSRRITLVAFHQGRIIGQWALLHREHGWSRHVCELRGIVHPDWRHLGLGNKLIYDLLTIAHELEKEKVIVEVVARQKEVMRYFEKVGFQREALFKNHVKDDRGRMQDLIVMSMDLMPAWRKMEELVHDRADHGGGGG